MKLLQRGQTMVEYLVVAMALATSFFIAQNTDCPGYDNCIAKLAGSVHSRYQGYSNSITDLHFYPDGNPVKPFLGGGNAGGGGGSGGGSVGGGGAGGGPVAPNQGLYKENKVQDSNGADIGVLRDNGTVVDDNGDVVGTYENGKFTPNGGNEQTASVAAGIVDEEGNNVLPTALVDCDTGAVKRFVYISTVNAKLYDPFTLDIVESTDCRAANTQQVFDSAGRVVEGSALVDGFYYSSILVPPNPNGDPLLPDGEVVMVTHVLVDGAGVPIPDTTPIFECAVLPNDWEAQSGTLIDSYLKLAEEGNVIGSGSGTGQLCAENRQIGNLSNMVFGPEYFDPPDGELPPPIDAEEGDLNFDDFSG